MRKIFTALFILHFSLFAIGQPPSNYIYGVEVGGISSNEQVKVVSELISSFDPEMTISYSEIAQSFKLRSAQLINANTLEALLVQNGFQLGAIFINTDQDHSIRSFLQTPIQKSDYSSEQQYEAEYAISKTNAIQQAPSKYNTIERGTPTKMTRWEFQVLPNTEKIEIVETGGVVLTP